MAKGFTKFEVTEKFISSLPKLLSNDESAITWNAGTAFPTLGLSAGMPCFRTDEKKIYIYDGTTWQVLMDLNDLPLDKTEADDAYVQTSDATQNIDGLKTFLKSVVFNLGAVFKGVVKTKNISGVADNGTTSGDLYLNYDGNESYSRKVFLGGKEATAVAVRKDQLDALRTEIESACNEFINPTATTTEETEAQIETQAQEADKA